MLNKDKLLNEAYNLMLAGLTRREIINFFKKNYNVSQPRTEKIIYLAKKEMLEVAKEMRQMAFEEAITRYRRLLRKCEETNKIGLALKIQERLDKIFGLESAKELNVNYFENISDEIKAILKKYIN